MTLGTVFGSTVQCGSPLAVAQTPNRNGCGVGAKPRAWSGLKPSWPVNVTVKPQPDPGTSPVVDTRLAVGTLKVMKREMALALIATVPSVLLCASMYRCPNPCTSISLLQAALESIA